MTKGCSLYAPMSVHWEIGNAFSVMFKRHSSTIEQAQKAVKAYREIPIKFIDVPLEQSLEIAYAQNMYAYDAYLIQCTQLTSTPLLTLDSRLKKSAKKMGVQLLEVSS